MTNLSAANRIALIVVLSTLALLIVSLVELSVQHSQADSIRLLHERSIQSGINLTEVRMAAYRPILLKQGSDQTKAMITR